MPATTQTVWVGLTRLFTLVPVGLRRHVARQIKEYRETEPSQRRFRGRAWWNFGISGGDGSAWSKVQALVTDGAGRGEAGW